MALLAILVQLSTVAIVAGLAMFMRAPLSPLRTVVLVAPIVAAALLPISFGGWGTREIAMGWGTREIAMAAGLGLAGTPPSSVVVISVLLGLLLLLSSIPGRLIWLLDRSRLTSRTQSK